MHKSSLKRKGAVAVEFAILLPVFLVILFGIIEYGYAMASWIVVTNAASQGCRAAIVGKDAESAVKEVLWTVMKDDRPAGELRTIVEECKEGEPSQAYPRRIKVSVTWKFNNLIGFLPPVAIPGFIHSESVMAVL
jgi:uncharacterized protein (UPF0333 family)